MNLKDGTLLVCFLGDRASGGRTVPRVAVWRDNGPLEEVTLSWTAARLIARLALPRQPSLSGLNEQGRTDRIAAAMASPLRHRSAQELRDALGYKKTHEWRARRDLKAELAAYGLEHHLSSAKGTIGLVDAVSDVAALVAAVRHEERERAVRLLEAVAGEGGAEDQIIWLLSQGWPGAMRAMGDAAVSEARTWAARPRLLPEVASGAEEGRGLPESSPSPLASEEEGTARIPARWVPLPVEPRRRPRVRLRWSLAAGLAIAIGLVAAIAWPAGSSPARAPLPGAWSSGPDSGPAMVANLTKETPLANQVAASLGDILLLRVRLPMEKAQRQTTGKLWFAASLWKVSHDGLRLYASICCLPALRDAILWVATAQDDYRLRVVPGTTQLVNGDGQVIRSLHDLTFGKWDRIGRLSTNGPYFGDVQLQVVKAKPGSPGQVSADSSVRCDPSSSSGETANLRSGSVTTCTLHLVNLGPGLLPTVAVHIGSTSFAPSGIGSVNGEIQVGTRSAGAEPSTTELSQYLNIEGAHGRNPLTYVPHSAKLFDASFEPEQEGFTFTERTQRGEFFIGPLGGGAEHALFLQFKVRVH